MPRELPVGPGHESRAARGAEWVFDTDADVVHYCDICGIRWGVGGEYFASAAVVPASTEQVQAVVQITNKYRLPRRTISMRMRR